MVQQLQQLARQAQIPVIASLHQPRSSIWRLADDVLVLAPGGRVVYSGTASGVQGYMRKLGFRCPRDCSPAEWLLDLVSVASEDPEQEQVDLQRCKTLTKVER